MQRIENIELMRSDGHVTIHALMGQVLTCQNRKLRFQWMILKQIYTVVARLASHTERHHTIVYKYICIYTILPHPRRQTMQNPKRISTQVINQHSKQI